MKLVQIEKIGCVDAIISHYKLTKNNENYVKKFSAFLVSFDTYTQKNFFLEITKLFCWISMKIWLNQTNFG